jgi:hypothetical protein
MTPAHECLYDVAWQCVRLQVVNRWATEEETRRNISLLLAYIGRAERGYWKFIRVWRCINIVTNAERVAESANNVAGLRLIKVFKRGLELEFNRFKHASVHTMVYHPWNWGKVASDLSKLYSDDRELFNRLQSYSERRLYKGGKADPTDKAATPELARFVRMMRDVVFDGS